MFKFPFRRYDSSLKSVKELNQPPGFELQGVHESEKEMIALLLRNPPENLYFKYQNPISELQSFREVSPFRSTPQEEEDMAKRLISIFSCGWAQKLLPTSSTKLDSGKAVTVGLGGQSTAGYSTQVKQDGHWTLAIVNLDEETIHFMDSLKRLLQARSILLC